MFLWGCWAGLKRLLAGYGAEMRTLLIATARWAHLPYEFLDLVSRRIINEVPGISRVTYDISGKPPKIVKDCLPIAAHRQPHLPPEYFFRISGKLVSIISPE